MITDLKLVVEGPPQVVQAVADAIEAAHAGAVVWNDVADDAGADLIRLEGWSSRNQGTACERRQVARPIRRELKKGLTSHRYTQTIRAGAAFRPPAASAPLD